MSGNAMSLKARIRNLSKEKNVSAQVILQNYMFERFLERLSKSDFKNNFILKGGMLIASIVGIDSRCQRHPATLYVGASRARAALYVLALADAGLGAGEATAH